MIFFQKIFFITFTCLWDLNQNQFVWDKSNRYRLFGFRITIEKKKNQKSAKWRLDWKYYFLEPSHERESWQNVQQKNKNKKMSNTLQSFFAMKNYKKNTNQKLFGGQIKSKVPSRKGFIELERMSRKKEHQRMQI